MIKKILLVCALFTMGTLFAQNTVISILGGSTPVGWSADLDMATTDGVNYTYSGLVVSVPDTDPGVKFRKDHGWDINWGADSFPGGTGTLNGANIPAINGTYDVAFNISTGVYSFAPAGVVYDAVALVGTGTSIFFSTTDGLNYTASAATLPQGDFYFTVNGQGHWGSSDFPLGLAFGDGNITVPANTYNISFTPVNGSYSFSYVAISLIGDAVANWETDIDMATTDGINYTITGQVFNGDIYKFRQNHDWIVNWGTGAYPSGTTVINGDNMTAPAGTYNVAFNRETGDFSFTDFVAGITGFSKGGAMAFPNPAQNAWTFSVANTAISTLQIVDITGKTVYSQDINAAQVTVSAADLATGVYFARLGSAGGVQTIRIVKN